jgi:hypothetical protein
MAKRRTGGTEEEKRSEGAETAKETIMRMARKKEIYRMILCHIYFINTCSS